MSLSFDRRGAGEPLVLLHGIGSRWQAFVPVLDPLAADFEVVRARPARLRRLAAGARRADPSIADSPTRSRRGCAEQGIEGAHVAGNSTGGGVALELAARGRSSPRRVALAPIGFWSARERAFCQASLRNTRASRRMRARCAGAAAAPSAAPAASPVRQARRLSRTRSSRRSTPARRAAFDDVDAAFEGYLAPPSAADRVPVTVAWGAKDRLLLPHRLPGAPRPPRPHPRAATSRCPTHQRPCAEIILAGAQATAPAAPVAGCRPPRRRSRGSWRRTPADPRAGSADATCRPTRRARSSRCIAEPTDAAEPGGPRPAAGAGPTPRVAARPRGRRDRDAGAVLRPEAAAGAMPAARTGAGVRAQATMTITKARAWSTMPRRVARQRVAEDDDAAGDAGDVGGGAGDGDDRDGVAVLEAAGRGVEGGDRGERW